MDEIISLISLRKGVNPNDINIQETSDLLLTKNMYACVVRDQNNLNILLDLTDLKQELLMLLWNIEPQFLKQELISGVLEYKNNKFYVQEFLFTIQNLVKNIMCQLLPLFKQHNRKQFMDCYPDLYRKPQLEFLAEYRFDRRTLEFLELALHSFIKKLKPPQYQFHEIKLPIERFYAPSELLDLLIYYTFYSLDQSNEFKSYLWLIFKILIGLLHSQPCPLVENLILIITRTYLDKFLNTDFFKGEWLLELDQALNVEKYPGLQRFEEICQTLNNPEGIPVELQRHAKSLKLPLPIVIQNQVRGENVHMRILYVLLIIQQSVK